jgi:SpoVK/Ycf46/Vps4 family AAA+-type ATPase
MDHFEIVLALCRAALQNGNPAVANHIRRLGNALKKAGESESAEMLFKLEQSPQRNAEIQPSRVVMSFAADSRESLNRQVRPPVDRESSAPLAEIIFPDSMAQTVPILGAELSDAIEGLMEEWGNVERLQSFDVPPAMSVMLFGEPGTGKTMLAHSVAAKLGLPLVVGRLDGLVSSFLGTTARNIANLFAFADRYKCILLLDEFDAIAKLRDDPNELGELKRVVNTLLQCLDSRGKHGFTIAITNHQGLLDPAVWRRFDIRIQIPMPGLDTRRKIIAAQFGPSIAPSEAIINFLAWLTQGHSGADIQRLAEFIKRKLALRRDSDAHIVDFARLYVQLSALNVESENRVSTMREDADIAFALANDVELAMSQDQLAELFGRGQPTISKWLKGRRAARSAHAK